MALIEDDLTATSLHGKVAEWHAVLRKLREHYADPAANPRERSNVGAARDEHGAATGITITSTRRPRLDETTVRQTGALVYQLAQHIEQRITDQLEQLRANAAKLDRLPAISTSPPSPPEPITRTDDVAARARPRRPDRDGDLEPDNRVRHRQPRL